MELYWRILVKFAGKIQNLHIMKDESNTMPATYAEALAELEGILAGLRSEGCDIDTLAARTRRAAALLAFCRSRLTRTEEELSKVLEELDGTLESS